VKPQPSFIATGYRYFLVVAETGSVRAAARSLNVAASAISRQLGLLEGQLGIALFDRSGRSLALSPAGNVLLRGLRGLAQATEETLDHLGALRGLTRGIVQIATVESISVSVLPDILLDFARSYPGIQVSVTVAGSDAVTELVREHQADLGFTFNPTSLEGLSAAVTRDMSLGAIMSPGHPLARSKRLTFADCLAYPIAWPSLGLSLRAALNRLPAARDLRPAFECNSLRLMATLAREGNCIAFQTLIGIEQDLAAGSLVWIPLADKRLPVDRLMLVRRKGQQGRIAADAFADAAEKHLAVNRAVRK
jgi:DNA-binding transcriptional LysR family regulator